MKKLILIIALAALFFISSCSSSPTHAVVASTQAAVKRVQVAVAALDKDTTPECRTAAFAARMDSINAEVAGISASVDNIGQVFAVEKEAAIWDGRKEGAIVMFTIIALLIVALLFARGKVSWPF